MLQDITVDVVKRLPALQSYHATSVLVCPDWLVQGPVRFLIG